MIEMNIDMGKNIKLVGNGWHWETKQKDGELGAVLRQDNDTVRCIFHKDNC